MHGKVDKQLSMSFEKNNFILEYYRKLRIEGKISREKHRKQFNRTRAIYQRSDEYRKTADIIQPPINRLRWFRLMAMRKIWRFLDEHKIFRRY